MRICPADSHPSGGFPVWEYGLRNFNLVFDLYFIFSIRNPKSEIRNFISLVG